MSETAESSSATPPAFDAARAVRILQSDFDIPDQAYGVLALMLNAELLHEKITYSTLMGLFFFVGAFETAEEAQEKALEVSARTGIAHVLVMPFVSPVDFRIGGTSNKISFRYPAGASIATIQESFDKAKARKEGVQRRLAKEVEERSDSSTLSYFIQQLSMHYSQTFQLDDTLKRLEQIRQVRNKSFEAMKTYLRDRPAAHSEWKQQAEPLLVERDEEGHYRNLVRHFDEVFMPLLLQEDDEVFMPLLLKAPNDDDPFANLTQEAMVCASSSGEATPVPDSDETKALTDWQQVLRGGVTLPDWAAKYPPPTTAPTAPVPAVRASSSGWGRPGAPIRGYRGRAFARGRP